MKHSKISSLFDSIPDEKLDSHFVVFSKSKWSYKEFIEKLDRINGNLDATNLSVGDRLIISTENDEVKILLFHYALRKGLVPVLLHSDVNVNRAQRIVEDTVPSLIILDEALFKKWEVSSLSLVNTIQVPIKTIRSKGKLLNKLLKRETPEVTKSSSGKNFMDIIEGGQPSKSYPSDFNEDDIAYILYTSGTTANPKGVIVTHKNLLTHLDTMSRVYQLLPSSRLFNVLSLEHADGMIMGPLLSLYNTATLIRPTSFEINNIPHVLGAMYKHRVSHFFAVPAMLALIDRFSDEAYDDSFENEEFKMILSVSSHIEEKLWASFTERFNVRIVNVYGLTETVGGSFFCGPEDDTFKLGTIGKPVDTAVKIVDDNFQEVGVNQKGELIMKGDHISPGYYKNEISTKSAFHEGWLLTGDIAIEVDDGFFKIVGRKKNLVIAGGFNIHPEEVNEVIMSHDGVLDCCCIGIPDAIFGDKLVAAIVRTDSSVDSYLLGEFCRKNLEPYKVPKSFYFFEDLPKGISGKINLPELKELIDRNNDTSKSESLIEKQVLQIVSNIFNVSLEQVDLNSNSKNLEGWDSLAHLALITRLEKEFNRSFNTAEIITMNSVKKIVSILSKYA